MTSSPDLICRNTRRAMFQYPARRMTRATTTCETMRHERTSIRIPELLSLAQTPDLVQIKHRHGEIVLSYETQYRPNSRSYFSCLEPPHIIRCKRAGSSNFLT